MKTSNKKKGIGLFLDIIMFAILVYIDQITKNLAVTHLKDKPAFVLMDGVFELHYLENRGAAFGMLQNQKMLFVVIAVVMLAVIAYMLFKLPRTKHFIPLEILLVLVAAGAVGNLIDRVNLNYVVDFFYFKLIDFPIFNVADIYITCSCFVLVLLMFFYYSDEDMEQIAFFKRKD